MSTTIKDIKNVLRNPISVSFNADVQTALNLMGEYRYSQLPVVNANMEPLGMITSDSILRALSSFNTTLDQLRVEDAMINAKTFEPDEDLFDLLDDLRDEHAVLIVDSEGKLAGIVTSYDATEYFRLSAEDMIMVRDIELDLRQRIQLAFTSAAGELDQEAIKTTIREIINPLKDMNEYFRRALLDYLRRLESEPKLNEGWIEEILRGIRNSIKQRKFEDLSFKEYTDLIVTHTQWERYAGSFSVSKDMVKSLLEGVNKSRNKLAHFKGDLSAQERNQLKHARDWLEKHQPSQTETAKTPEEALAEIDAVLKDVDESLQDIIPIEETSESRYGALAQFLRQLPLKMERILLSFSQIEQIIGGALPTSARQHRSWWANDSQSHVQSQQWLNVGWRITSVNMTSEVVTFSRMVERQAGYIKFFTAVLDELRKADLHFPLKNVHPSGLSWTSVAGLLGAAGGQSATIGFAFTAIKQFRIELYIDTGNKEKNKRVFDLLYSKCDQIESALGQVLHWERMENRRASRIALYYPDFITILSSQENLDRLAQWALDHMPHFQAVIGDYAEDIVSKV